MAPLSVKIIMLVCLSIYKIEANTITINPIPSVSTVLVNATASVHGANVNQTMNHVSATPNLPHSPNVMSSIPLEENMMSSMHQSGIMMSSMHFSEAMIQPSENIMSSMQPTPVETCKIVPSTCICGQIPIVSVMSTLVNMAEDEETVAVDMTMVSSVNIEGFLTSYMAPATISMASQNMPSQNDTTSQSQMASQGHMSSKNPMASRSPMASQSPVAPQTPMASQSPVASQSYMASQNIMASQSQSHMASQNIMASQSNMASQGHMASQIQNNIQCNCIGRHTACLQILPTTVSPPPASEANENNENSGGNNNGGGPGVSQTAVPSAVVSLLASQQDSAAIAPSSTVAVVATSVPPTLPTVCNPDCAGMLCGEAIMNACSICVKGTTGLNIDHGKDCNNVCNGTARNDSCNACTNPPANDVNSKASPFADCHGTCFGSADIDSCGNCSGGETGKVKDFWRDACGVCGGDNSTCMGCDGVPNSGKMNDSCLVCGGDGSACTTISSVVPSLLPKTSSPQSVHVYGAGLLGDSIKCLLDGVESNGKVANLTYCQCAELVTSSSTGDKSFTVTVVKSSVNTPTATLTITLYDPAVVKVSGMEPPEMVTKETTEVTFSGSGFDTLDSSAAVCIIDGTKKLKAVLDGSTYKCTVPEFENSVQITLALSLNGVHDLTSDVSLTRTVYAGAPNMTKAQLSDTGALLNVEFDKDVNKSTLATCGAIFDSASVQLLGTSPDCKWSDGRHLTITPGAGVTVVAGSSLTLKADAVKSGGEEYSKYASGSVSVSAPTNPVEPVSVIVGPTQISSCGHLTLDGSQSSGGGGRDLEYKWSLVGTTDANITAELDKAENKSKVFINGTLMTAGSTYKFKLEVKNFLGAEWKEKVIDVMKATQPLPEVTVEGPLGGKAFAANSYYITALAKAASCSSDKALTYTWTVACTNDDSAGAAKTRVESTSGFTETSSKSALKIDAGALVGGKEYKFTVVVALKASSSIATTVTTTVNVEWSPLEPAITGGYRTLGQDSGTLKLDAKSSTVDPDNTGDDLSCSWVCKDMSNQQPCYSAVNKQNKIALPNECVITVASTEFAAGKSYEITSQVSKGSRIGSSSILLTVLEGNPPAVSVLKPSVKVVAGEKVSLEGKYNSNVQPTKVEWVCAQDANYRYIDLTDTALISSFSHTYNPNEDSFVVTVLQPNVLTPGGTYKFILNVDDGSKVGSSNVMVEVRSGPTSGTFDVTPMSLEALEIVTLTASRWVTDSDAYPLEYEFGFVDGSNIFQPWATQTSNEYKISAPSGYGTDKKLTLKMKVKDAFGSLKWLEKIITVNPPTTIDEDKVEDLIGDSIQEAEDSGDYSTVVPSLLNVLEVVGGSDSASANFTSKITNSTLDTLIAAVDATSLDEEKAEPILKTFLKLDTNIVKQPKQMLDSFETVVGATNGQLDDTTVKETLKWMADLVAKVDVTDADVLKDINSIDDELASSLAKNVDLGQPAIETTDGSARAVIKVEHSLLRGDIPSEAASGAAKVKFGDEMQNKYGFWECGSGKYCLGVKLKFINYKKDYISSISSTKPNIVSGKIVSVSLENPESGSTITVNGLAKPIQITFETGAPKKGKTFVVYYYKKASSQWSNDGLTSTMQGFVLTVTSTHLTTFAPAEEDLTSTSAPNTTQETTVAVSDNVLQLSFVLSNTTWDDDLLNSSHPEYQALRDSILQELNEVYKNDPTLKSSFVDKFVKDGDVVKAILKMTFDGSNDDPGKKLRDSLADGKLGSISVDKDSVQWVDLHAQVKTDSDDDTELIIGTVFGVFFGLAIILLVITWFKNRQSRRKVGSSNDLNEEEEMPKNDEEAASPDDVPA